MIIIIILGIVIMLKVFFVFSILNGFYVYMVIVRVEVILFCFEEVKLFVSYLCIFYVLKILVIDSVLFFYLL